MVLSTQDVVFGFSLGGILLWLIPAEVPLLPIKFDDSFKNRSLKTQPGETSRLQVTPKVVRDDDPRSFQACPREGYGWQKRAGPLNVERTAGVLSPCKPSDQNVAIVA